MQSVLAVALVYLALAPGFVSAACPYHTANAALHSKTRSLLDTTSSSYMESVMSLDFKTLKTDITALLRKSQDFWPADFGYYGGLIIRLAWHCAGSYRTWDGRGGCDGGRIQFAPEAKWPDNTNLDMARQLLAPIKEKYGDKLSWGDLITIAGNVAIESAGGPSLGVCLGRVDDKDGSASIELGPSTEQELIAACPNAGDCQKPLGPTTLGLIYVNPEGPLGKPDPTKSCAQIRDTFGRMGMNDSETVALIGGGHAFGKAHGACATGPGTCGVGAMKGKGPNTVTSGFEGPWTSDPTVWSNEYFKNLLGYNWVVHKGPGGHYQWKPTPLAGVVANTTAAVGMPNIMMLTADVSLLKDPKYLELVKLYASDIKAFENAFAHAFYKLTTRDMGPVTRCVNVDNSLPPAQPWQCPLPAPSTSQPDFNKVAAEIATVMKSSSSSLPADKVGGKDSYAAMFATLAWQCASSYRQTDHFGGCNGARIRFSPMKDWPSNKGLDKVLAVLQPVKDKFPNLSWADLIVLAGNVALGDASIKFYGGRSDATEACVTDAELAPREYMSPVVSVMDDAKVKGLTLREYIVLFATPRSPSQQMRLGYSGSWSAEPVELSNAFFKTLTTETWEKSKSAAGLEEYKASGKNLYITPMDWAITQDASMMAIAQEFAGDNAAFLKQFATSWTVMMNADKPITAADAGTTITPSSGSEKNNAALATMQWGAAAIVASCAALL